MRAKDPEGVGRISAKRKIQGRRADYGQEYKRFAVCFVGDQASWSLRGRRDVLGPQYHSFFRATSESAYLGLLEI